MLSQRLARHGLRFSQASFHSRSARYVGQRRAYAEQAAAADTIPAQTTSRRGGPGATSLILLGIVSAAAGAGISWETMRRSGLGFASDADSLRAFEATDDEARLAEDTINKHPLVAQLRSRPELTESRPHMKMPSGYRAHSLSGGALSGPHKIVVPPYAWTEDGGKSLVSVSYVGDDLCGHPGIVHGGLLATMLDEGMARCCFGALPHNIGVTANLNIDYRKPTPANSFLVLRAETTKVEGRKAWVKGRIELLAQPGEKPTVLAEATALFISPKFAAMMPKIQ